MERVYTTSDEHNIVFEWKIDKIDHYFDEFQRDTQFSLTSPIFSTGATINDEWHVRLKIINSSATLRTAYQSSMVFILCSLNNTNNMNIKCSSCILDNEKNELFKKSKVHYLLTKDETVTWQIWPKATIADKNVYLPNNTLTFRLDLTVYDSPNTKFEKLELNIPKCQMSHDFTELYNTKMGSDVIINVRNTEFRAHKIILMARSPVLAAMFSHDMIEKKENKISIPDITPEIFERVLKYIYTDEVTDVGAYAESLLESADKYQIQSLKDSCQESLCKNLTVENALTIMTLADRHSAKYLLEFTNKFIASNIEQIIKTQNYKELQISNPLLALSLSIENLNFQLKKLNDTLTHGSFSNLINKINRNTVQ
ncbi:speckle-type POZ protein B-like [Microplitis mediator]|uniref:speckle-type POZ protein B-like n=1 Tax=Microplitis mediator TaxID=375433 RepID=UPI0025571E0C|nr:speckle-type POZ protein B-like [Microplitis mediator]